MSKSLINNNIEGYKIIFNIENIIRAIILKELKTKKNWFHNFKQRDWYKNTIKKIEIENKFDKLEFYIRHEIYYTNFNDLFEIIGPFYNTSFNTILPGRDLQEFKSIFNNVANIRNKIMHCRPIVNDELRSVDLFYNQLKKIDIDIDSTLSECYDIKEILYNFKQEITEHKKIIDNNKHSKICINYYYESRLNTIWWYSKYFENYTSTLDTYYLLINKLNEFKGKFNLGLKGEFDLDNFIENNNIKNKIKNTINLISKNN